MGECLITDEDEVKKAIRATCKDALKAINRNDDNCPILLEKMTFNLFSHYIPMKKVRAQECISLPPTMEVSVVH